MKIRRKSRIIAVIIGIGISLIALGIAIGWYSRKRQEPKPATLVRENPGDYKFVDPILLLQIPEDDSTAQFQSLKKSISSYIDDAKNKSKATDISVYFRELNTDRWVGVNQTNTYAPASMLKVISLIAFLRQAQDNTSLYTTNIKIDASAVNVNANQDFYPPLNPVKVGQIYAPNVLLSHMIINSDNNAANTIDEITGIAALNKTFNNLKVPIPDAGTPTDFISPITYSRLFRSLYNGTYLSPVVSEQALELLSKTTFNDGLVAGVPEGTVVAHKFGERTAVSSAGATIRELHDCGIVYAVSDPYLLCVMTKGDDFTLLEGIIKDISKMAWGSIQELNQAK